MEYCHRTTLQTIFGMCPRLQTLSIDRVYSYNLEDVGRPPKSLVDLALGTVERPATQLLAIYDECRALPNLKRVALTFEQGCAASDLGPVLRGAVELSVDCASGVFHLTALHPGNAELRLSLYRMYARYRTGAFPPIFLQSADCFAALDTIRIPLAILAAVVSDAPHLPAGVDLQLKVAATDQTGDGDGDEDGRALRQDYPWDLLRSLAAVAPRQVVIDVMPRVSVDGSPTFPAVDDARALLARLINSAEKAEIIVRGFLPGTVPGVAEFTQARNVQFVS